MSSSCIMSFPSRPYSNSDNTPFYSAERKPSENYGSSSSSNIRYSTSGDRAAVASIPRFGSSGGSSVGSGVYLSVGSSQVTPADSLRISVSGATGGYVPGVRY